MISPATESPSPRLTYYNPVLKSKGGSGGDGTEVRSGKLLSPSEEYPANLISSLCEDGNHRPALDIDQPYMEFDLDAFCLALGIQDSDCHMVPSVSGNVHMYLPLNRAEGLQWPAYVDLLGHLVAIGYVETAYVKHSIIRRQTLLRIGTGKGAGTPPAPVFTGEL